MFIIVLGQHVSILIESSLDPSKNTEPYLVMFKMDCGIPNTYILDITMYKMHVSLCSYYTIRTLINSDCTISDNKCPDCIIRTYRHMHFIHSYIKNVSVWDPTAHFKHC